MIWLAPIKVAGITFHLKDVTRLSADAVMLRREPVPGIHERAIAIYGSVKDQPGAFLIGYVPRNLADMVPDEKLPANGVIVWKSEPPYCGLQVQA